MTQADSQATDFSCDAIQSDYVVSRLTPADRHAVHFYYDVTPESPDGRRIVYLAYDADPPCRAEVMVSDAQGRDPICVGVVEQAIAHGAGRQQWIDDQTVAFCPTDAAGRLSTVVVNISDQSRRSMPGALRMLHPTRPLGLTCQHDFEPVLSPWDDAVHLMDLQRGELRRLFSLADLMDVHPLGRRFAGAEHLGLMHTKWAPDGRRFFVMVSNTAPLSRLKVQGEPVHAVFVADADGANLRYVMEESHHPAWGVDPRTGKSVICLFQPNDHRGQDMVAFDPDDRSTRVLLADMLGKHACPRDDGRRIVVDVIHWPQPHHGAVIVYDLPDGDMSVLARYTQNDFSNKSCHQHPTWSRAGDRVYFSCIVAGKRGLFSVDLASKVKT